MPLPHSIVGISQHKQHARGYSGSRRARLMMHSSVCGRGLVALFGGIQKTVRCLPVRRRADGGSCEMPSMFTRWVPRWTQSKLVGHGQTETGLGRWLLALAVKSSCLSPVFCAPAFHSSLWAGWLAGWADTWFPILTTIMMASRCPPSEITLGIFHFGEY